MSFIDDQVLIFANFSQKVQNDLIRRALATYQSSSMEYVNRIIQTDIARQISVDLGFGEAIDGLLGEYDQLIKNISPQILSKVPPGTLEALKTLDEQMWFEHVSDIADEVKRTLVHASLGGVTEFELKNQLLDATKKLSKAQIGSLTNTALTTASRATFAAGANELPDNTKYIYIGPIDGKNRPSCGQVLHDPQNAEGFTISEIGGLPVDFVAGGGFNCRHIWELAIQA